MDKVKLNILGSAKQLFYTFGFRSVTLDQLAQSMGMSKKTIYAHFKDKADLVYQVTDFDLKDDEERVNIIRSEAKDVIDEMVKISFFMRSRMTNMNPIILSELEKFFPKAWNLYLEFKSSHILECIEENLENGKKSGLYRSEINSHIIALLRLEEIERAFDQNIFPKTQYDIVEVQMEFFWHFLHGIMTSEGRKLLNKYISKML